MQLDWNRFKEDAYWMKIVELITDRRALVKDDIADPKKTTDLLQLRTLQQELADLDFFLKIPDLFRAEPDMESRVGDLFGAWREPDELEPNN